MADLGLLRPETTRTSTAVGATNRRIGWTSIAVGVGIGLIFGLWSFDGPVAVPQWLGGYDETPRRLARLGHIAFVGLGILNVLLAREVPHLFPHPYAARTASFTMNLGNTLLPLTLIGAAFCQPIKYATALPALSVFVSLCMVVVGIGRGKAPHGSR